MTPPSLTARVGGRGHRLILLLAALLLLPAPLAAAAPGAGSVGTGSVGTAADAGLPGFGSTSGSVAPGDLQLAENPDWMGGLPDDVGLTRLSLPGTHDTMARGASVFALTQDADLPTQLRAGIRVLDIRTRHFRDAFPIHHNLEYLHANFTDVVVAVTDFLRDHPTETIVMRLKEEYTAAENTRSYEDTLNWYLDTNPDTADRLREHLWRPAAAAAMPTLGQVRGKIVVLEDFPAAATYGPRWGGPGMNIQDTYELAGLGDLDRKWSLVRSQFARAAAGSPDTFFVNHLSATGAPAALVTGTVPVTVARGSGAVPGILARTQAYLDAHPTGRTGAVMADFPTAELVDAVVARNFR